MLKFLPKLLVILQNLEWIARLMIPVLEQVINKDLDGDGHIGARGGKSPASKTENPK